MCIKSKLKSYQHYNTEEVDARISLESPAAHWSPTRIRTSVTRRCTNTPSRICHIVALAIYHFKVDLENDESTASWLSTEFSWLPTRTLSFDECSSNLLECSSNFSEHATKVLKMMRRKCFFASKTLRSCRRTDHHTWILNESKRPLPHHNESRSRAKC